MWEYVGTVLTVIFLGSGLFFLLVGVIGLIRLPDVYTRLHAATKCDTMGAGLVLLGLALQSDLAGAVKLIIIALFIWVTNPTAAHVIAKAAWVTGVAPISKFAHGTKGMEDKQYGRNI